MIDIEHQIKQMVADTRKEAERVVNKEVRDGVLIPHISDIIEKTPVGVQSTEGTLRGSWEVSVNQSLKGIEKQNKRKGRSYVKGILSGKSILGKTIRFGNARVYAHVVQEGRYKKNPRVGTYNKYIKAYEIRSRRGYSKQAPKGMVDLNKIRRAIERRFR